jgi:hypothetical protein
MIPALAQSELAIHGGTPVRRNPFPSWPHFAEEEIAAVEEVMRSGRVSYWTGEQGKAFEQEFAVACGCKYALAVANGTLALEIALRGLGIGAGDEVVTSSRTFIASASSIAMCGATPVFADVDRDSQNITPAKIEAAVTPRTRAIIAVHLAGWPCDMDSILEVGRRRELFVIEDCAQAQGATWNGKSVGSFADVAAFSFCQDKIMTTLGEGGMLATNDRDLWERAWALKDHGKNYSAIYRQAHATGFRWLHDSIGTNGRMTEAQAAVGRIQLQRVPGWLKKRRFHAKTLSLALSRIPGLRVPAPHPKIEHAFYRLYAFVEPGRLDSGWNRDRIISAIEAEGVPCYAGSCSEVYLEKPFAAIRPPSRLPNAQELGETSLAFHVHPTLEHADLEDVCMAIEKVMSAATSQR